MGHQYFGIGNLSSFAGNATILQNNLNKENTNKNQLSNCTIKNPKLNLKNVTFMNAWVQK